MAISDAESSPEAQRARGRPSEYSHDLAAIILERMSQGRSVRSIAKDDDMPAMSTIFKWLMEHKDFSEQYEIASNQRAEQIFEDTIEIADDSKGDYIIDGDGNEVFINEHVQRSRLRVDTRKWFVSKLAPKKYGEKQLIGSDPDNPLPGAIDDTSLAQRIAFILTKQGAQK